MANETLITDLVAQEALDQLNALDTAMAGTLGKFKDCATELAKGLKIPVEVTGDLEKLQQLSNATMQKASQAAQQYTQQLQQQQQVVANTSNTISRQLAEQEKLNKAEREAYQQDKQALEIAYAILGTRAQNYSLMAEYTAQMKDLKRAQTELDIQEKAGTITTREATARRAELMAKYDEIKIASQQLARVLAVENKESQAAEGSYQQLSQQLELMKKAYKQLNEAEKTGAQGKKLEDEIQRLDAHLKDLDADMGQFQRNVGNYAIAGAESLRTKLKDLTEQIAELTMQYDDMDGAMQRSEVGQQLKEKITQLTEEAGKYRDAVADVKQSINASASDTRWLDTMLESGKLMVSTFGLAKNAAISLGMSEDSLEQSMLGVQRAMQAIQALQVIQNTLQKQSNVMKGIAILQSKALAAAARIEAAATASATGATKAQTVAQAAFNAVAKANPYVLLATAILAVVGLIIGYTAATKDATKADEEAKKAAEARKESMDNMAQSFGNTAGEMIAKYKLMREQWNALGDDIAGKRQYLEQHKSDFEAIGEAAYGAGTKISSVTSAERLISDNTAKVEDAIQRRARAMAAYAEYIRLTQMELQELEKLSTFSYRNYHSGEDVNISELNRYGVQVTEEQRRIASQSAGYGNGRVSAGIVKITQEQAAALTKAALKAGNDAATEAINGVKERYEKLREVAWDAAKANGITEPASFRGGGGSSSGGGSGAKNSPQVKAADDVRKEVDAILIEGYKSASEMEDKYTAEWLAKEKERIEKQRDYDVAAAEKKRDQLAKDIETSTMSEEEKSTRLIDLNNATADIIAGIERKAADEYKQREADKAAYEVEKRVKAISDAAAGEQAVRNAQYQQETIDLEQWYTLAIQAAHKQGEDTTKIREEYERAKYDIDAKYATDTIQLTIDSLNKQLEVEDLTEEERERIRKELADAVGDLANEQAEQEHKATDEAVEGDERAMKKREQNLQDWVQRAGEAVAKISEFMGAMYDNQIAKIEEQMEAEQKRYDAEVAHIEELAERGAITTEEAEIRKRDAAAATQKKQEALEKRKSDLEYKKAVIEKANSIAQIGIATALGIMKASPNIPLMAFIGAMGAIQVATALAQPIKAYAEGTKGKPHPGGLALVGDGDKAELVMYNGKAWVTPDEPTLVNLPRGAEVIPDLTAKEVAAIGSGLPLILPRERTSGQPIIINDYSSLEGRVAANTKAVTKALKEHQRALTHQLRRQRFNNYIADRI